MTKVLILIGAHICTAPRPQKEAEALAKAGHEVTVAGFWSDPELVKRDRQLIKDKPWQFEPIVDFQPQHKINNFIVRLRARIAKELFQAAGVFSPDLFGYGAGAMLRYALKHKADLTIVHSEGGLWVGQQLLARGYRVGVDFEDWFSEDLLPEARAMRPIPQLKFLESQLINQCKYCLTTSKVMAEAMATAYEAKPPKVVYNTFPSAERQQLDKTIKDRHHLDIPSIHWFSQTIGPGRGLELLFQALPLIKYPVEIHLRGNYPESARHWLEPQIPSDWEDRLFIHPTVPNHELLSRIAEHDIGLALEIPYCLNKQYTVSNKIFQYMQAGLAIIATDTAGQCEILSNHPEIGVLIPSNQTIALADAINKLVSSPSILATKKQPSLSVFEQHFCWENQEQTIITTANCAL